VSSYAEPDFLQAAISNVKPLDVTAQTIARERLDSLTKPAGSLGRLERLAVQLIGSPAIHDRSFGAGRSSSWRPIMA
jgi:NaMN:DMB phosphoribosyltransferase